MVEQPIFLTQRLLLRPFTLDDVTSVQQLAGKREIADTTISIPHPYELDNAVQWINAHRDNFVKGNAVHFCILEKDTDEIIGAIELRDIDRENSLAEMGFWIASQFWGKGFASEAARCLLRYGFEDLDLNRIYAHHMLRNPASGKVLKKIGMKQEGILRQRVRKWGRFEDVAILAILRQEWLMDDK